MKLRSLILLVILLLAVPSAASAEVPGYFPVQAYLTDSSGVPIDGDVDLEFNIYDAATGGAVLFSETQTVQANAGAFTAYLGTNSELDLSLFSDSQDLFLGVTVNNGDELTPRQRLATVPFAARAMSAASADDAKTLDGRPATDFEPITYTAAAPLEIDANNQVSITTTCATDSILKWTGSAWECTPDAQLTATGAIELNGNTIGLVTCPNGQVLKSDGTNMACAEDADTTYTAGNGLSLAGGAFAVDYTSTQRRVSGACNGTNGQDYITGILADGTVVCGTDSNSGGDITAVNAGSGLTGGGDSGAASLSVAAGGIASAMLQDGAVTSAKLASGAVTNTKLGAGAVTSDKISDGTITSSDIGAGAVGASEIATGAVGTSEIATGAVGTSEIATGAVGNSDLANDAVTSAKIDDYTITDVDVSSSAAISHTKIDFKAGTGTFVVATTCPAGNNEGPSCDNAPPGTYCEYDPGGAVDNLDSNLDNCGIYDWYFRRQ
jgi:hypothetical protein